MTSHVHVKITDESTAPSSTLNTLSATPVTPIIQYPLPDQEHTPTPFRLVINQLRQACNLPPRMGSSPRQSPESLRKSYLALRERISPQLLKSTLPLVSKAFTMDFPPELSLSNFTVHDTSDRESHKITADSINMVIVDNTCSSTQTVVPFLGNISNPLNIILKPEVCHQKPMVTDFFKVLNPKKRKKM